MHNPILFSIFLIFVGSALIATAALWARQSLLIAYMSLGILTGPWCLGWIADIRMITEIGDTGILFLLFLLGLHLDPQNLLESVKETLWVALISSVAFVTFGFLISYALHFHWKDALVIGVALMFSSTIIALKLIPNKLLHHTTMGEALISILLLQDLLAIMVLVGIRALNPHHTNPYEVYWTILSMPVMLVTAFFLEKYFLQKIFQSYGHLREYLLVAAVAWCLGMAQLADTLGLSGEIGAFIGGVAIASDSRVALYLAECMKPLRDFFLVLFFFSVGATFDISFAWKNIYALLMLTSVMTVVKPVVFRSLCRHILGLEKQSWELGVRIGQISEFSILVGAIASSNDLISSSAATVIQGSAMISFLVSTYWVVTCYQTPIGIEIMSDD